MKLILTQEEATVKLEDFLKDQLQDHDVEILIKDSYKYSLSLDQLAAIIVDWDNKYGAVEDDSPLDFVTRWVEQL